MYSPVPDRIAFRRSTRCASSGCVEVSVGRSEVQVRDSKDPRGSVLRFTLDEWSAFTAGVAAGEFDISR